MKAVVFLQNAWSPIFAGQIWPRESWLRALHASRSGQRLRTLLAACPKIDFHFNNVSPLVGDNPDSVMPPCEQHICRVIFSVQPDVLVLMGRAAEEAVLPMNLPFSTLILPHPAHRLVTNRLLERAGKMLKQGFEGIVVLRQKRGFVETERRDTCP